MMKLVGLLLLLVLAGCNDDDYSMDAATARDQAVPVDGGIGDFLVFGGG
jgi:hypothetical protein